MSQSTQSRASGPSGATSPDGSAQPGGSPGALDRRWLALPVVLVGTFMTILDFSSST
jgi:hypothetical protein